VGGALVGQGQVVVAQQRRHVGAAGRAPGGVGQHHDMRDGQRGGHGLGWTGVDLVVQHRSVGVLRGKDGSGHAADLLPDIVSLQHCKKTTAPEGAVAE